MKEGKTDGERVDQQRIQERSQTDALAHPRSIEVAKSESVAKSFTFGDSGHLFPDAPVLAVVDKKWEPVIVIVPTIKCLILLQYTACNVLMEEQESLMIATFLLVSILFSKV